jgi:hypothetical protein
MRGNIQELKKQLGPEKFVEANIFYAKKMNELLDEVMIEEKRIGIVIPIMKRKKYLNSSDSMQKKKRLMNLILSLKNNKY